MASVIIAEPAGAGSWHACTIEIDDQSIRRKQWLKEVLVPSVPDAELLAHVALQILDRTEQRDVRSLLLLLKDSRFAEPLIIAWQGRPVHLQVIDPLEALQHAIPSSWNSFLLIDVGGASECALVKQTRFGQLERTHTVPLDVSLSSTKSSWLVGLLPGQENGERILEGFGNEVGSGQLWQAAHFFGVTKVVCRLGLLPSNDMERNSVGADPLSGAAKPFEILCIPPLGLIGGVLNLSRDSGRGAVRLVESDRGMTLRMSCERHISYDIFHPVRSVLDLQEEALARTVDGRPVLLAVDKNVERLYGDRIYSYANEHLKCLGKVVVLGSEQRKNWEQVEMICSEALRSGLPRDGAIVAFGGGVTLDLAGMAASVFRRGVPYVRVPTTLVGLADAGVGIKQGFNFASRKNVLGAFYPPVGGISDLSFLTTLPEAEIRCGLAEIVKIAIVLDSNLFELLEDVAASLIRTGFRSPEGVAIRVLLRAEHLMLQQLQPNLYEACHARLVDFGHTFSPGLESASGYAMRHGEAVALDMLISTGVAVKRGLCPATVLQRMLNLYRTIGLPMRSSLLQAPILLASAKEACRHRSGKLNLVVPIDLGFATYLQDLEPEDLKSALAMLEHAKDEPRSERAAGVGI